MRAAREAAFTAAIRSHRHVTVNIGYCGGCEVCGTTEEHVVCLRCGWDQHEDPVHPYPYCAMACPTVDSSRSALLAMGAGEPDFLALWEADR